jgi:hypothetical protein
LLSNSRGGEPVADSGNEENIPRPGSGRLVDRVDGDFAVPYDRVRFSRYRRRAEAPGFAAGPTVVVTTDRGRGRGGQDWTSHGKDVPGSDEIWVGIFGPDTPKGGELRAVENVYQSNVAATVLTLLGLDYREFNPNADGPIAEALASS